MNAVIYARYSSDNQREESIEGQLRECKAFAEAQGITVLNAYIDRSMTGKSDNSPEFQKMIKDAGKELFDLVIVWKLDRFARNRYDSAHYKGMLRKMASRSYLQQSGYQRILRISCLNLCLKVMPGFSPLNSRRRSSVV
jgi:DNA invertase Pin-like site-specific DNA recombinase